MLPALPVFFLSPQVDSPNRGQKSLELDRAQTSVRRFFGPLTTRTGKPPSPRLDKRGKLVLRTISHDLLQPGSSVRTLVSSLVVLPASAASSVEFVHESTATRSVLTLVEQTKQVVHAWRSILNLESSFSASSIRSELHGSGHWREQAADLPHELHLWSGDGRSGSKLQARTPAARPQLVMIHHYGEALSVPHPRDGT